MKYIVVLGDGMAGEPLEALGARRNWSVQRPHFRCYSPDIPFHRCKAAPHPPKIRNKVRKHASWLHEPVHKVFQVS